VIILHKFKFIIIALISLSGCGIVGGAIGFPPAIVQLLEGVSIAGAVYDGAAVITDNKTINDRILSKITDEDCKTIRLFQGESICVKKEIVTQMPNDAEWMKKKAQALKSGKPIRQHKILLYERSSGTLTTILPPEPAP
jgi:hypothetical protein